MFARTRTFVNMSGAVVVLWAAGCSGMRLAMQGAAPTAPPDAKAATPQQVTDGSETMRGAPPSQSTVTAIEEFLERTRDYARPPAPRASQPLSRTLAEDAARAVPPSSPVVGMPPPAVNVTGVTSPRDAENAHDAYDWNTLRFVGGGAAAATAPLSPTPVRSSAPERVRYDVSGQPTPGPVSDPASTHVVAAIETQPRMLALPVLQSVSISASPASQASVPRDTGMSNVSVEVVAEPARPTWRALIEELTEHAETRGDVVAFWRLGLARLASDQFGTGIPNMSKLSVEARSLLESLFQSAAAVRDQLINPVSGGTVALEHVEALRRKIADAADPIVSSVALCRRVTTFGVFEEMGPANLVAGRATQTIVYCELDNLRAQELDDGRFETRLATRIEVLTNDGRSVWTHEEPEIIDQCRRRRRDFFLAQRLTLPATLPAGEYVLKVMVEDSLSGRTNEAIEPFVMSSAISLAEQERNE